MGVNSTGPGEEFCHPSSKKQELYGRLTDRRFGRGTNSQGAPGQRLYGKTTRAAAKIHQLAGRGGGSIGVRMGGCRGGVRGQSWKWHHSSARRVNEKTT
ncbi:hypothetical protein EYF80_053172 [Liparis tanakae]|uniref:Uncharacterized protein n=1 Tax=Liparis tanakae TaxID=230148 RepID=A0A4Z2F6G7_9TELE|nr:hypothetical protein EYF80_053172 [Liparis tanakae]